jgi:hypothetical protein
MEIEADAAAGRLDKELMDGGEGPPGEAFFEYS